MTQQKPTTRRKSHINSLLLKPQISYSIHGAEKLPRTLNCAAKITRLGLSSAFFPALEGWRGKDKNRLPKNQGFVARRAFARGCAEWRV